MSAHFSVTCGPRWRSVRKTRVGEPRSLVCQFFLKSVKIHRILQLVEIRANLIVIAGRMVFLKSFVYKGVLRIHGIWVQ